MRPLICIEDFATGTTETREMTDTEYAEYLARTDTSDAGETSDGG